MENKVQVEVVKSVEVMADTDYEKSLFDLNRNIEMLSSKADKWDYFIAVASGVICGMIDALWVGNFDLQQGRSVSSDKINEFVIKTAQKFGCRDDDIKSCVRFLEERFPLPADGNTPDFGGGLQHHLRDFAHHPSIVGLIFSLLTQFTGCSYGTDTNGLFIIVPVPEKSRIFIGEDVPDKIFKGTVIWFFHLVSDMAGSSSSAGIGGGTGIPGPLLSLAKELSALPVFRDAKVKDYDLSVFLSKVFNGTIFAKRDSSGKIIRETVIKFDFRGELGAILEIGKQAVPVICNDVIVRSFYFLRRLAIELKDDGIQSLRDLRWLDWEACKPFDNPTVDRMLTISSAVFSVVDLTDAVISQEYWVSVNYVGLGRFTIALGKEMVYFLSIRDVKKIKSMYEIIRRNTYGPSDDRIYVRMGKVMGLEKFGLTLDETEILYNLEYLKTCNDVKKSLPPTVGAFPPVVGPVLGHTIELKKEWIEEWKTYMEKGFPDFVGEKDAALHWYSEDELRKKIANSNPEKIWYRLVLLEAMVFEPYFPLSLEKDKKGKMVPSKKYDELKNPIYAYKKMEGDKFLDGFYNTSRTPRGYVPRLRRCYDRELRELNEVLKTALTSLAVTAAVALGAVVTAGMFAPAIAVTLVGANFSGLTGAALTSACLAFIGGGAVAAGGAGMAGGMMVIVGGGAILGVGVGAGLGGTIAGISLMGKKETILQSAKLMVSVKEIFLNDEHDVEFSNSVYERYVQNEMEIEKELIDLKHKEQTASEKEKKALKEQIKNTQDSIHAMDIAAKSLHKFISSFKLGKSVEE